jgi:hypothetical protein
MGNMVLGDYTFDSNPSAVDGIIQEGKSIASVKTYTSVAVFSWGLMCAGSEILLAWDYMTTEMYDYLYALFAADEAIVFDPQDGSSKTFNVEITDLTGKYHLYLNGGTDRNRRDVKMTLLILSEV